MTVKEFIKHKPLLFDGAMGTWFSQKARMAGMGCEAGVLSRPDVVLEIHREYLAAGADALKTNTFAANRLTFSGEEEKVEAIIARACELAFQAVGEKNAFVFGDIGPIPGPDGALLAEEYLFVVRCMLKQGVRNFIFETHPSLRGVTEAAVYLRANCPEAFLIVSFAVQPDGYTREGGYGPELCRRAEESGLFDSVGFNCVSGAYHMLGQMDSLRECALPLSMMPNAGYPTVVGNRTVYQSDPVFFGRQLGEMAARGAKILGGCCGTTPEYIRQGALALEEAREPVPGGKKSAAADRTEPGENLLWRKLEEGKRVIAVELDPPKDDSGEMYMAGAKALQAAGVDAITIADCPIARPRMDSSLLACKLRRELGIEPLPHMTCRDRNLNATKALLLGLCMEGVHNVLLVTGDPIPSAERDEVKSVYQFHSRKMASYVRSLNENELSTPFRMFGALNVNARNFHIQLGLAKEKVENGVSAFLTQPVLTERALENLSLARKELPAGVKILGGIIPVVSARNARYMQSEISGIEVDPRIAERMEGKDREECSRLAVEISCRTAKAMNPYVDGFYLMTPFQRTDLICEIVCCIREMEKGTEE